MTRLRSGADTTGTDPRLRVLELDAPRLLAEARRRTRLEDLDENADFREALGLIIRSYETEARLNFIGRAMARYDAILLATTRLRLVEDRKRYRGIATREIRRPVFLTGLPRSGLERLHALLASDPRNRVPLHSQTVLPSRPRHQRSRIHDPPMVAAKRKALWLQRLNPAIRRMEPLAAHLPQECITMMNSCFMSFGFQGSYHIPTYQTWLEGADLASCYAWHRRFLQHLQARRPARRWVLRAPGHLFGLAALFATYPDATVVFTHRDPVEAIVPLATLTVLLRGTFSDAVDVNAVGCEISERWATAVQRACSYRDATVLPANRFVDVLYTDLLHDPIATVRRVYACCDMALEDAGVARMKRLHRVLTERRDEPPADAGCSGHWIRERYRQYRERFLV